MGTAGGSNASQEWYRRYSFIGSPFKAGNHALGCSNQIGKFCLREVGSHASRTDGVGDFSFRFFFLEVDADIPIFKELLEEGLR